MKNLISNLNVRIAMALANNAALGRNAAVAVATTALTSSAFALDANTSVNSLIQLFKLGVTLFQWAMVLGGMASICYGLLKWKKKGQDNGGDQVEARQIWMPISAGAAMICIWAIVEFAVTAAGGSTSDIGRVQSF
ncbi:DUF6750 family protein [Variovorax sp. RA8]|uniref:DUF6750 family protein n=1 Tax=Variovorax sp. (strain JCM 16519 / RA8) TaxID=662548 RepID=UPI001317D6EF|nr:DUF6750 family protein [Variovorax sp. RA8]VTU44968.1 hypothetical protein RA8P2_00404 [Variovorax sp. RA8]